MQRTARSTARRAHLHERAAHVVRKGDLVGIHDIHSQAEAVRAALADRDRLGVAVGGDDEADLLALGHRRRHRHCLSGRRRLVEQRALAHLHARQVRHHRLEVQQRLQAALHVPGLPGVVAKRHCRC